MSLISNGHLDTKVVHSLVDSFFEGKKALVKERLMESVKVIVDGLFEEMVGQVKEMLLPSKDPPSVSAPPQVIPKPPVASKSPIKAKLTLPKVKKVLPNFGGRKQIHQPSTSKPTANVPVVSVSQAQFGQKRTAESEALVEDTSAEIEAKKAKLDQSKLVEVPIEVAMREIGLSYKDIVGGSGDTTVDNKNGSGDAELVNNIDIASIHVPNTSKEQQKQLPIQSGKFPCTEPNCGKHFFSKSNLKTHLRTHSNAKPFCCTFPGCSGEFSQRAHAIRHILNVHLKEKPGDEGEENNNNPPDPATYLSIKKELL